MKRTLKTILGSILLTSILLTNTISTNAQTWIEGTRYQNPETSTYVGSRLSEIVDWMTVAELKYNMNKNMNLNGKAKEMKQTLDGHTIYRAVLANTSIRLEQGYDIIKTVVEPIGSVLEDETSIKEVYLIETSKGGLYLENYSSSATKKKGGWSGLVKELKKDSNIKSQWQYRFIKNTAFIALSLNGTDGYAVVEFVDGESYVLIGHGDDIMRILHGLDSFSANSQMKVMREDTSGVIGRVFVQDTLTGEEKTIDNPFPEKQKFFYYY